MAFSKPIPKLDGFDKNRFWANVRIGEEGECWEWADRVNTRGYGRFWLNGKEYYAHRVAYFLTCGSIPSGKSVLHTCDNTSCAKPGHLYAGTQLDNMRDKNSKGRGNYARGARNGHSVLTEKDVLEIRKRCASGETRRDVAKDYGISGPHVSNLVNKKSWAHV